MFCGIVARTMSGEFFTLYWWLSVVVVGIIINLASAYLKSPLDTFLSSFSARWKARVERNKAAHNALVENHLADPVLILLTGTEQTQLFLQSILFLMVSALLFLIVLYTQVIGEKTMDADGGLRIVMRSSSVLLVFAAMVSHLRSDKKRMFLKQVEQRRL